jgi:hypothetical protein
MFKIILAILEGLSPVCLLIAVTELSSFYPLLSFPN